MSSSDTAPKECVGKARLLVQKFAAQDPQIWPVFKKVHAPIKRRIDHHPVHRLETLVDAQRIICGMPAAGLLVDERAFDQRKRTLEIFQLRVASARFHLKQWQDPLMTPALVVAGVTFNALPRRSELTSTILGVVYLSALARWFQRSFNDSEAHLMSDHTLIGRDYDAHIQRVAASPRHAWSVETTEGGSWVGYGLAWDGKAVLGVSSYSDPTLPADEEPLPAAPRPAPLPPIQFANFEERA